MYNISRIPLLVIVIFFILLLSPVLNAVATTDTLTWTYPWAPPNEITLKAGSNYVLLWDYTGTNAETVKITYGLDNEPRVWTLIVDDLPISDKSYSFSMPSYRDDHSIIFSIESFDHNGVLVNSTQTAELLVNKIEIPEIELWASIDAPSPGEEIESGSRYPVQWLTTGTDANVANIHLSYRLYGDPSEQLIASTSFASAGFNYWNVPTVQSKTQYYISIDIVDKNGGILFHGTEVPFVIAPTSVASTTEYSKTTEFAEADTIDKDLNLPIGVNVACTQGTLLRTPTISTVYYCGRDGKRYSFPDENTYFSWFNDFSSVTTISNGAMGSIPFGGVARMHPGYFMVKIQSSPKVYAISRNGVLRWISSETAAERIYGPQWNKHIRDISPAFFVYYTIGDPIQ